MTEPARGGTGQVLVLGGANMDLKARSARPVVRATSNPGTTTTTPGGVGRNVAENLARLGTPVALVAAVGGDPLGADLLEATSGAGVDMSGTIRHDGPTGTYTAVLDDSGELVVAVSDMAAADAVGPEHVEALRAEIAGAPLVVVDGNLRPETVAAALDAAAEAGVPVVLEPVSVPKARRLTAVLPGRPVFLLTPNLDELGALTGLPTGTEAEARDAAARLHEHGAGLVWIRRGGQGSLLSTRDGVHACAAIGTEVADVTGAGDAMLAAFCHAWLRGASPADAVLFGHAAAALTVASNDTVRPDLSHDLVADLVRSL